MGLKNKKSLVAAAAESNNILAWKANEVDNRSDKTAMKK